MADFSRITTQDHALQKVQDATARALRSAKEDIDAALAAAADAVTPAQLAAHAALTSGVHGLPVESYAPGPTSAALSSDFNFGTGTSWADVTGLTVTFTAVENERVMVFLAGKIYDAQASWGGQVTLNVAGTDIDNASNADGLVSWGETHHSEIGTAYLTDALSSGSTTIKVVYKVNSAGYTGIILREPARISVVRLNCDW